MLGQLALGGLSDPECTLEALAFLPLSLPAFRARFDTAR